MPRIKSKEEYVECREKHIVQEIYDGNDNLPLETKDQLLRSFIGDLEINFHSSTSYEDRTSREKHVNFTRKVAILESNVLYFKGFICGKLC